MMRQHMLVSGTTGSGKTEFLLTLLLNSFANGGGGIFVDGKGDLNVHARVLAMAQQFGRGEDVYVLNFMNRSGDHSVCSNTINPFQYMASDAITNLLVSLMDDVGADASMWKGRAVAMFTGVIKVLVWLRDFEGERMDVGVVRDSINLRQIIDFADPAKYPSLPLEIRKSVRSYLGSLPGFQADKGYKQSQTTLDQHGYLEMQWTKVLGMMADVYGDIFNSSNVDIDIRDIIQNRRILVVLLPALEKSSDEVASLGKFIVSIVKALAFASLGSDLSHNWEDVLFRQEKRQDTPFTCIFDEVSHYMVDGLDLLAAQARSLNFNLVFSTQEIGMMHRRNYNVANNIIANCATKVMFLSNEPRVNTALAFLDLYNSRHLTRPGGFFVRMATAYRSLFGDPVPVHDRLRNLGPGEFFLAHRDCAVFAKGAVSNFELRGSLKPVNFFNHREAGQEIVSALRPDAALEIVKPLGMPLPIEFEPLIALNNLEALPGGHAFLSASLQVLASIVGESRDAMPTLRKVDEIMEIGV
jgi:intracellular multiplication protein IcmO